MRIIIGCECSGRVREAFRELGHDAVSCDLQDTEIPGPHIKGNILDHLDEGWEMGIFHPECRFLCFSGDRWIKEIPGRLADRKMAYDFFIKLYNAPISRVCVENSHSIYLNTNFRKPNQTIHPYHFGDPYKKSTCLWLRGIPPLVPTNVLPIGHRYPAAHQEAPGPIRSKNRSRTYMGIANAMAAQWGGL